MLWGLLPSPWLRGDRRPLSSSGRTRVAILLMLRAQLSLFTSGAAALWPTALPLTKQRLGEPLKPKEETRLRIVGGTLHWLLRVLNVFC